MKNEVAMAMAMAMHGNGNGTTPQIRTYNSIIHSNVTSRKCEN